MNKKNIVLFFGAGASQPMGYKTTVEFFESINEIDPFKEDRLFNIIIKQSNYTIDIEKILEIVNNILDFSNYESKRRMFSFVENGMIDIEPISKEGREFSSYRNNLLRLYDIEIGGLQNEFGNVKHLIDNAETLKTNIQNQIIHEYNSDKFTKLQLNIYKKFIDIFASSSKNDLSIFTTNYDNSMNRVLNNSKFYIDDGFNKKHHFDSNYEPVATSKQKLITYRQLHGSIKWRYVSNTIIRNDLTDIIKIMDKFKGKTVLGPGLNEDIGVIYPSLSTKREIYDKGVSYSNLKKFQEKIDDADLCIVIGFSFRDELAVKFANISRKGKLFIVDKIDEKPKKRYNKYKAQLKNNFNFNNSFRLKFDEMDDKDNVIFINDENVFLEGVPTNDKSLRKFQKWFTRISK